MRAQCSETGAGWFASPGKHALSVEKWEWRNLMTSRVFMSKLFPIANPQTISNCLDIL